MCTVTQQDQLTERTYKVISTILNVPVDGIRSESSPDTIPLWDSLKHIELVLSLEEEFQVEFGDDEILELLNVGSILKTVRKRCLERGNAADRAQAGRQAGRAITQSGEPIAGRAFD